MTEHEYQGTLSKSKAFSSPKNQQNFKIFYSKLYLSEIRFNVSL